jgi:hypothetical protein
MVRQPAEMDADVVLYILSQRERGACASLFSFWFLEGGAIMNEKVSEYLKKEREQELIKRGICHTEYYGANDERLKNSEWLKEKIANSKDMVKFDEKSGRYYVTVLEDVTDEEYELVMRHAPILPEEDRKKSALPKIYNTLAVIVAVIGAFAGFWNCFYAIAESTWLIALCVWAGTFFTVLILVTIGKIVGLLEQIRDK